MTHGLWQGYLPVGLQNTGKDTGTYYRLDWLRFERAEANTLVTANFMGTHNTACVTTTNFHRCLHIACVVVDNGRKWHLKSSQPSPYDFRMTRG